MFLGVSGGVGMPSVIVGSARDEGSFDVPYMFFVFFVLYSE
jgi:hypothetical protein